MLVTVLPTGGVVRAVLLGQAVHLKPGCVVVNASSSSPCHTHETTRRLAGVRAGLALIYSPIMQAYVFALAKGDATLMVGARTQGRWRRRCRCCGGWGRHVFVMGELGAGQAMETLNNYVSAASVCELCDALIAGRGVCALLVERRR